MAKFKSNKGQVVAQLYSRRDEALEAAGRILAGEVGRVLRRRGRSGAEYTVPGTGVQYVASAPGEPPAPRTGDLARSYVFEVTPPRVVVGSRKPQARLEFGWGNILPRPHLRPAERSVRDAVKAKVREIMAKGE